MRLPDRRAWAALPALLWLCAPPLHAADSEGPADLPLRDQGYVLTAWSRRDGLPPDIDTQLDVSASGIVYMSAGPYFYHFDGSRFARVADEAGEPLRVERMQHASIDDAGGLWTGTANGKIVHFDGRRVRSYGAGEGLPEGMRVRNVLATPTGVLAATQAGLYRLDGARWQPVPIEGIAGRPVTSLALADDGIWATVDGRLAHLRADLSAAQWSDLIDDRVMHGLIAGGAGQAWLWQRDGRRNLCELGAAPRCFSARDVIKPVIAPDAAIWWFRGRNLLTLPLAALPAAGGAAEPLSVDPLARKLDIGMDANGIAAGPDGSIWIDRSGTLARLRRTPVMRVLTHTGAIAAAPGADVWVSGFSTGLSRIGLARGQQTLLIDDEDRVRVARVAGRPARALWPAAAAALGEGPVVLERFDAVPRTAVLLDTTRDGRAWLATLSPPALWVGDADGWRAHAPPPLNAGAVVRGIAQDRAGDLLLLAMRDAAGLYRYRNGAWQPLRWRPDSAKTDPSALAIDADDTLWIARGEPAVLHITGEQIATVSTFGAADIGRVMDARLFGGDLWLLGTQGLARRANGQFSAARFNGPVELTTISAMEMDDDGALWLGSDQGLVRITRAAWSAAMASAAAPMTFRLLDDSDGLDHPITNTAPRPALRKDAQGQLWIYTTSALYRLDPRRLGPPVAAPALRFAALSADGVRLPRGEPVLAPPGTTRLSLAFEALGETVPGRTRLRYRIPALAEDWRETSGQELALDRLPPGAYRLELQASDSDGGWNGAVAISTFNVQPTFWQTAWAKWLLGAALSLVVLLAMMLRVRQVAARERAIGAAKLRERERIARDIHDTLLQGVNGLLMSMQAVVNKLEPGSAPRERLAATIAIAGRVLVEGRDRVASLRAGDADGIDLEKSLRLHAADLRAERDAACELRVEGTPRALRAAAADELAQIGREALTNAFVHAQAACIHVVLRYDAAGLQLSVQDDGAGLRSGADDALRGHWGITGMRERAALLGARLDIGAAGAGGVRVAVLVPAARAYATASPRGWLAWLWHRPRESAPQDT